MNKTELAQLKRILRYGKLGRWDHQFVLDLHRSYQEKELSPRQREQLDRIATETKPASFHDSFMPPEFEDYNGPLESDDLEFYK